MNVLGNKPIFFRYCLDCDRLNYHELIVKLNYGICKCGKPLHLCKVIVEEEMDVDPTYD